ncbi:PREDICTED: PRUPE_1G171700 [Prunus dulcis]|uniref:PREDICTED: PRUPE_1G171700 n=1 Tax=Prunus dulcis TaxID=3755 RepID=A0A5E4GM50_PRUDU|nr:PREDICTED: PRUPE_1G171700 [Prunus dulcis]
MKALKEQRCEREPSPPVGVGVDDDDFAGLACPPLDDLEAVFILESETTTFDPSNLFDDVKLDDHNMAIQEKPNKPPSHGTGKSLETLRLMLSAPPPSSCQQNPTEPIKSDAHHQRQDWDDEGKLEQEQAVDQFDEIGMMKRSWRLVFAKASPTLSRVPKVIDIKNLPMPSPKLKPQRGRVLNKNKLLTSSRKCRAF